MTTAPETTTRCLRCGRTLRSASGWVIYSGGNHSDPISNKPAAMRNLREIIADYFSAK